MIDEAGTGSGVARREVIGKKSADEDGARRIARQFGGGVEDAVKPGAAACESNHDN